MRDAIGLLATLALGIAAGAVLAEGAVLVPWWREQPPEAFLAWYAANASRLFGFFGTLEMVAGVLVIVAAVLVRSPVVRRGRAAHGRRAGGVPALLPGRERELREGDHRAGGRPGRARALGRVALDPHGAGDRRVRGRRPRRPERAAAPRSDSVARRHAPGVSSSRDVQCIV
jgi:hypothetical protein